MWKPFFSPPCILDAFFIVRVSDVRHALEGNSPLTWRTHIHLQLQFFLNLPFSLFWNKQNEFSNKWSRFFSLNLGSNFSTAHIFGLLPSMMTMFFKLGQQPPMKSMITSVVGFWSVLICAHHYYAVIWTSRHANISKCKTPVDLQVFHIKWVHHWIYIQDKELRAQFCNIPIFCHIMQQQQSSLLESLFYSIVRIMGSA